METLLRHIQRRHLLVGWAAGLLAVWHLLTDLLWSRVPFWRPLFALYCLGSLLLMLLSAWQLRKARKDREEKTRKAAEDDCWVTAALCAVMGVWFAAKGLLSVGDPDDMMAGFLGVTIGNSYRAYRKLEKTLRAQRGM